MANPIVTHLHANGEHLCCVQDGPTAPAPALLDETHVAGACYCPNCARAVLTPIVELAQSRCGSDPLLDAILALTVTPPDHAAAVLRILCPALVEFDAYVEQVGGRHD